MSAKLHAGAVRTLGVRERLVEFTLDEGSAYAGVKERLRSVPTVVGSLAVSSACQETRLLLWVDDAVPTS